jgi:hypothetical protein
MGLYGRVLQITPLRVYKRSRPGGTVTCFRRGRDDGSPPVWSSSFPRTSAAVPPPSPPTATLPNDSSPDHGCLHRRRRCAHCRRGHPAGARPPQRFGRAGRLEVRIGLSARDVTVEGGRRLRDSGAARLCALAEGGQSVASEIVRALAGSAGGHRFRPVGAPRPEGTPRSGGGLRGSRGSHCPLPPCPCPRCSLTSGVSSWDATPSWDSWANCGNRHGRRTAGGRR